MICLCNYNPVCDIQAVDQFGFVDLGAAFVSGVVPEVQGIVEEQYNHIEDPRSILGSPRNMFDAVEMQHSISNYVPPATDSGSGE